jgi:3-oxoadipate enol-lactonase
MTLARDVAGAGPPLLLLHAGVCDARSWAPLVDRLGGRFRTIAPDAPGFGRTPLPDRPVDEVGELVALLDELEVARTAVVGNSFGGLVAMQLAQAAPERVSALVLLASAAPDAEPSPELAAFEAAERAAGDARDADRMVALNIETWVRDPAVAPLVAEMVRTAIAHQLDAPEDEDDDAPPLAPERFAVPALLVDGGLDLPDFAAIADELAATIPGAQRATVPDAGHLVALERPDAVATLLADFLG